MPVVGRDEARCFVGEMPVQRCFEGVQSAKISRESVAEQKKILRVQEPGVREGGVVRGVC